LILDLANKQLQIVRDLNDSLHDYFQSLIHGIKELKLNFARKTAFVDDFEILVEKLRYHAIMGSTIQAGTIGWGQMLILVVIGIVLFVSPSAEAGIQTGFPLLIIFLMTPIESVMNTISFIQRGEISIHKINQLGVSLEEYFGNIGFTSPEKDTKQHKTIEFENVEFLYGNNKNENSEDKFLLGPINCRFKLGEIIFLIGGNGSGKTTFAKLLAGLYTPDSGRILIDDISVDDDYFETYRQNFGCIFSDFFLFDKLRGIDFSDLQTKTEMILENLRLSDKVKVNDGVLSTTKLSQGQRKRLALLSTYLENRPIYIFDEWAADQDVSYKKYFYQNILPTLRADGKTIFVISHDDIYYPVSDRIIKFDSGKIVSDSSL
jgi:putative pyoverdin transport system ATP-binding/permease protein